MPVRPNEIPDYDHSQELFCPKKSGYKKADVFLKVHFPRGGDCEN